MGINPPSLYAAFGNKEGLFRRALDRYVQQRTGFWNEALAAPMARGMIAHLLHESANFLTEKCNPPGCLLVRGALSCSDAADPIVEELTARRTDGEVMIRNRLAKQAGELPSGLEPSELARYVITVLEGMSVRGRGRREPRGASQGRGARTPQLARMMGYLEAEGGFEAVRGRMIRDARAKGQLRRADGLKARAGRENTAPGHLRRLGNAANNEKHHASARPTRGEKTGQRVVGQFES
jgi:AcrR family transcriptional regulator